MDPKNLCSNQNEEFFKREYLTSELSYEVGFLCVIRHFKCL